MGRAEELERVPARRGQLEGLLLFQLRPPRAPWQRFRGFDDDDDNGDAQVFLFMPSFVS